MRHLIPISAAMLGLLFCMPASAEIFDRTKPGLDRTQEELFKSSFISVDVPVPYITPTLADISRGRSFTADELISQFFGGRQFVTDSEPIVHPVWGGGTRYKSGVVLTLVDSVNQTSQYADMEVVPAFLDVYTRGFVYQNNVPHQPMVRTDVKVTGTYSSDIKTFNAYSVKEGQREVEDMIGRMFGPLVVPEGFQSIVQAGIQEDGERLFVYRAYPEYIATVEVPAVSGGNTTVKSGIPILDVYTHVLLDGDKTLAGMEYFWDSNLRALSADKQCYSANQALVLAREAIYEAYGKQPPLLTVTDIKLGYYQSRENNSRLEPGWLFDAWYSRKKDQLNVRGSTSYMQYEYVSVPMPFAINAITGKLVEL